MNNKGADHWFGHVERSIHESDILQSKAYAQAGLHLCCLQTPEDRFSRGETQID